MENQNPAATSAPAAAPVAPPTTQSTSPTPPEVPQSSRKKMIALVAVALFALIGGLTYFFNGSMGKGDFFGGLKLAGQWTDESVVLTWEDTSTGVWIYKILRSDTQGGTKKELKAMSVKQGKKYTDSTIKKGSLYFYSVEAYNQKRQKIATSEEVGVQTVLVTPAPVPPPPAPAENTPPPPPPPAPTPRHPSGGSSSAPQPPAPSENPPPTSPTPPQPSTEKAEPQTPAPQPPLIYKDPILSVILDANNKPKLTWEDNTPWKETPGGTFTQNIHDYTIYRVKDPTVELQWHADIAPAFTTFTDTKDIEPGVAYYYIVKTNGQDTSGNKIPGVAISNQVSITVPGEKIATPEENKFQVIATGGDNQITITWSDAPGEVKRYNLYKVDHEVAPGVLAGEQIGTFEVGDAKQFTDTNVLNGQTFYYQVEVIMKPGGGKTTHSSQVYATAKAQ